MRRPVLYLVGSVVVLGAMAWPALQLQTSASDVRMLPEESVVRGGVELVQEEFGLGYSSPIRVVVESNNGGSLTDTEVQKQLNTFTEQITQLDNVESVSSYLSFFEGQQPEVVQGALGEGRSNLPVQVQTLVDRFISRDIQIIVIDVISNQYSSSEGSKQLVKQLRDTTIPAVFGQTNTLNIVVGGETAEGLDVSNSLRASLIQVTIFTLILIFVVLLFTFRSILIPLKAIVLNLLSLGATYGILVMVFQWGGGSEIFGFGEFGNIQNFIPILLLGLLFSLSTDYEVFLLTRVKEEYDRTGDNEESVAVGLSKTAPMISGAAIIMIGVFGSVAFAGILPMQQLGLGMAVAILLDATIVRLFLVPATMKLLGKWNWWFPFQSKNNVSKSNAAAIKAVKL